MDYKSSETLVYVWSLYKHKGKSKSLEMGRYLFPNGSVGSLTSDFVILELNSGNCFDFAYTPEEGDNLLINGLDNMQRMEFIFKENKWIDEHYSPFTEVLEFKSEGIIKDIEQYCNYE